MVSKNNQWQHLQASAQRVPHYGLRKLSIGVASVLLSTTLYMGVSAHADTVTTSNSGVTEATSQGTGSDVNAKLNLGVTETNNQATGSGVNVKPSSGITKTNNQATGSGVNVKPSSGVTETNNQATGSGVNAKPSSGVTETNNQATGSGVNAKPSSGVTETTSQATVSGINMKPTDPASEAETSQAGLISTGATSENPVDSVVDAKVVSETPSSNATQNETVDSQWIIHYVDQADHKQELKAPTVITLQYARTNTSQSDGTTKYGDWSYVSGSFKQTGTPITVNDSDNPVKQDNVDKNGENMDVFTIIAMYPTIKGYTMHNNINGTRLHDDLANDNRQADSMSKDFYAEYDVAKERSVTVKFVDDEDVNRQVGQVITLTGRDGDTVNLNLTVPDKYQLANGQQLPTTYTFTNGSGDVTIHLVHKVVQREAAIDVQLELMTAVRIYNNDDALFTVTQDHWKQLEAEIKNGNTPETPNQLVKIGTLKGHVGYDLVNKEVVSFGDDWTGLKLGDQTYQLPDGTEVVNGVMASFNDDSWGKTLKEYFLKDKSNIDPDYINRSWHGYLSVNATNDDDSLEIEGVHEFGLQTGLAGNEPNVLARATGDRAATAVEMVNKTIDLNWLQDMGLSSRKLNEQDGQLKGKAVLPVAGVYVPYVEKTATRTIKVTMPDGKTTTVNQTATLAKQVDLKEGYHPEWTTGEWAKYDVSNLPGYTASQSNVAQQTVTGTTKDQTINITYTANSQTTTVVYQTEDGTPVHTTTVNGENGQTVKVPNEVPTGWHIVNGKVPSEIIFGPDDTPKTVVTIDHSHVTVTPDAPKTTSDKLPDNSNKAYPAGVSENDLNKTVTRTIKVTTPDGQTKTVAQTAKLTRNADVDEVTGEVSYGKWTTGQWGVYDVPTVPGYTASQTSVAATPVDGSTKDQTVDISYTANSQTIHINYVDSAGKTIRTTVVTGKTGETVNLSLTVPDKYQLADGQQLPTTYTFTAGSGDVTIRLAHKVVQREATVDVKLVMMTGVKIDYGVAPVLPQTQWERLGDNYERLADSVDFPELLPSVEVGTLAGHVNYDLVDNKVVSVGDDWTTLNLGGRTYQLPNGDDVVSGVMLDDHVEEKSFREMLLEYLKDDPNADPDYSTRPWHAYLSVNTTTDPDDLLTREYSSDFQGGLVGNELNALAKANGDRAATAVEIVDKAIDVSLLQSNDGTYTFSEQDGQLQGILPVMVVGAYVPYVEKTVTRTINVTTPDGKTTTVKQTATLEKQVTLNEDAHPDWTTGEWTNYDVPLIPGYTASHSNVAKEAVTGTTADQTVNITYTANPQTTTVVYQTEDGTPVHTTTVKGQTGQTVKVLNEVPAGWTVINGKVPSEIAFGPNGIPQTVVTIAHQYVTVDPDHPQNNGTKLPDNPAKTFNGVEANDLNKTITRTIKVTTPDGQTKTFAQTVKLTRTADVDEVTGEVTYSKWTTGKWSNYDVPAVPGYTASQNEVPATEVISDMTDQTIGINYTANNQTVHINYVDGAGKIVNTTTITGKTGETVSLNLTVPDKYQLADGQQLPATYTFAAYNGDITIDLTHKVVQREAKIDAQIALMTTVYSGNDDDDEYLASAVTQNQWTHLDNEIKDSRNPNSDKLYPLVKVGTLTGHVNYDLVDNKVVSFGDGWTSLNLGGQTYQMPDGTEVVNGMFIKNDLTWGKTLKEELLKYHPGVDPDYVNRPWHGYLSVNKTNMIASDFTSDNLQAGLVGNESNALAKSIGDQAATVVKMANKTIDSNWLNDNVSIFTYSDSEFSEQNGRLQASVFLPVIGVYIPYVEKTATRTINVVTPDGKTTTVKQTATLAKQVDLTKNDHPAWTIGEWTNYDVPTIPGYTASQSNVAKEAVTGATKDQTVNITYTANKQSTTIKYVDSKGQVVHTTTVNGQTGQTVKVSNEVPAGWKIINGKVPSEITFGPNGTPQTVVVIAHQHVTVDPDHPQNNGTKLPDNSAKTFSGVEANDLNKTVTRTIKVTTPDGQTKKVTQAAKLTRTADVDEVTGEVKYSDWSTGQWDKYDVPTVPGYTASQSNVAQQVVTDTTKDQTVNITYTANEHQISIEYVDNTTGQVLKTDHVSGKTGQTVSITPHIPDGWELVSGQSVPSEVTLGVDGVPATVIKVQPQERSVTVKFVDDQSFDWYGTDYKKQVGQAVTVTGRDGDTVDLKLTVPDKYQLADGQQLPTTYTFKKGSGDLAIHLKHQVVQREATIDVKLALVTIVPFGDNGDDHSVVTQAQWNQLDDELKSHLPGPQDILYPLVKVGTLTGHVGYDLVNGHVVSFGDDWTTLNLGGRTYQLPNGNEIVNGVVAGYVESFGKKLKSVILADNLDVDSDYVNRPWHGYLSVNATNNSNDYLAKAALRFGLQACLVGDEPNALTKAIGDRAATGVEMSDKTIDLGWLQDNVLLRTDYFSEQNGQLRTDTFLAVMGVYVPYVEKTVTRTINVAAPDGKTTAVKQTATLAKQVDFGKDAHAAWTTGEWTSYEVPTISGYTASQFNIAKETVTGTTKNQTVNITYTANTQTTHVNYVDDQGKLIHTTTVNGQTNQTVDVPSEVPTGWKLVDGQTVPATITFGPDGHADTSVKIEHRHLTVTPDKPQANGIKLPGNLAQSFHGVEASDLNKTVIRTIKVTTPDGQQNTITQTAKLSRTATVDEVTGEVTYGKWSTGQWDAYKVPTVDGYTATQTEVATISVDEHTTDQTVNVSYAPNKQTTTVKYVDDKGEIVHTTTVDGVTNQIVKVPSEVPAGWTITNGQVPSELTFGVNGHEPIEVTVAHQHVTVDPGYPQNSGTKLPDNSTKTFNGVETIDLNKTITRTIKIITPTGKTITTKQTAKLTRNADVDEVTGEVTYGNWTTGEWVAYDVPSVVGYTPSQTAVAKESVTVTSKDTAVEISYLPMQHQISVEYVDDDDHGKSVKTDQVSGKTDQTITVTPSAPAGYDLVDNNNNRTYTVTSDDGQTVQVHVKHHQVTTSESKKVTRTIDVHTPHDGTKVVKQTAELTRKVTTDQVTGDKTYGDWTTGQWKAYTPEAIPGYTSSTNEVPNTNVDGSSSDQTVDVIYTADAQKVEIVYVDDAKGDAVVKTDQVAGKTDETVKVTPDVPACYKVVGEVLGSYTMTADSHQTITVHLAHQTKTISENKIVTRTINVHTPHDGTKVVKQTAKLTRDVTTDQVTGKKTYGDWSATEWDRYAVPAVAGYVPSIKQVAQQVVNVTTTDQTVDVTYSSGEHTTHINYVDGDGNTVHTTTVKGQTDGTVQVPNETPAGWTVVGEPVPTELAFGPDGHADVTVTISHKHVTVTPDQPKTPTDKLPDNPAKTYPNGVGHDDLNKTITRTIKITTPDGETKTVEQTAYLTRTADVDEVTGEVIYGGWTTGEWLNYDVPVVPGYTSSQSEVPATKVTDDNKNQTVMIGYTANNQTTHVNYVDGNGKIVHTTTITGKTDQTVKVPNEVPAGWTVTDGQVPNEITFGPDGHADVTVTVGHQHVTVTPDHPKTPSDKLPNNPSKTYPSGVGHDDLNKTVTRTIEVATPAGKTDTIKQTAKLTRTADVDEVTGEVTYGKWTTGAWLSYSAPTVPGYTPSQAVVAEAAVYADTTNQMVKITYAADSHTTHINYVDEDGKVVHTTTVTGQTDQTVKVPNEMPSGWMITTGEVPSEVTFGPDGYTDVTITVGHRHVTVTSDDPKTDGAKLPDNPLLTFHNVDHDDLNKTITRTIKLNVPGQAPQVITQIARLTRTATVDEVTGEVIYGNWTSGQWDAYEVPAVDGYTASQTTIPAVNVTSETTSQEIVIDYVAVPTAQTTPSNNQTDETQVTPEKVVTVANGTAQETKQNTVKNPVQSTMQDTKQLPQTGNDKQAGLLSLIGSGLMASLAIFGLSKKKKHEN